MNINSIQNHTTQLPDFASQTLNLNKYSLTFEGYEKWALVAVISAIAVAFFSSPVLAAAITTSFKYLVIDVIVLTVLIGLVKRCGLIDPEEKRNEEADVVSSCIVAPIVEEVVFRHTLQPFFKEISTKIIEGTVKTVLTAAQLAVAHRVGLVLAAIVFGAAHLFNDRPLPMIQAINATAMGYLLLGPLYEKFGLVASIFAHMTFNTTLKVMNAVKKPVDTTEFA